MSTTPTLTVTITLPSGVSLEIEAANNTTVALTDDGHGNITASFTDNTVTVTTTQNLIAGTYQGQLVTNATGEAQPGAISDPTVYANAVAAGTVTELAATAAPSTTGDAGTATTAENQ